MPNAIPSPATSRCTQCGAPLFDGRRRYCTSACRARHEAAIRKANASEREPKRCHECGTTLPRQKHTYCCSACRTASVRRAERRAAHLYAFAMAGPDPSEIARLVRTWVAEDQKAGRPLATARTSRVRDIAAISEAYARGDAIKVICADHSIRPGTLYSIINPSRDRTGRMGGRRGGTDIAVTR